jgi:hypothetical protein
MRKLFLGIIVVLGAACLLAGCSLLIEGQEEGRPCKDGRCPFGFVCIEGKCEIPTDDGGTPCTTVADCSCDGGPVATCGLDRRCHCITLHGRLDGVGGNSSSGRLGIVGARLGPGGCGSETTARHLLCGGITQ